MSDLYLYKILSNVNTRDTVAIYGISKEAIELKRYIETHRPDLKIGYFVEYRPEPNQFLEGVKVINFREFLDERKNIDNILITNKDNKSVLGKIFNLSDMKYADIPDKYLQRLAYKGFEEVKKMFTTVEDKALFTVLFLSSLTGDIKLFEKYIEEKPVKDKKHMYLEYIIKNRVKTIVDTGEGNGYNSIVLLNELKDLETIYCFDCLHDYTKNGIFVTTKKELTYYKLLKMSDKAELVGKLLWDVEDSPQFMKKHVSTTTLDNFCSMRRIKKIDYIRFDIEALELNVLRGCLKTLKKHRPQFVFKIYNKPCFDYIEIMTELKKALKNYTYKIGLYNKEEPESVLYCIPNELLK